MIDSGIRVCNQRKKRQILNRSDIDKLRSFQVDTPLSQSELNLKTEDEGEKRTKQ
jgi:hypothetical protein